MSRKHAAEQREVLPDPRYQDIVITKFINTLMKSGKRSTAEKIFYGAFTVIEKKTGIDPLKIFKKALGNVKPAVEVKSRRIGGATYQIPVEVRSQRRQSLAIRWIRDCAKVRNGKTMLEKLADEIIDASESRGGAVKNVKMFIEWQKQIKAFAHLKW